MTQVSKPLLRELLDYSYAFTVLKEAIKNQFDDSFKGKSKEDCIEYLEKKSRTEILSVVFDNLHTAHQVFHVQELENESTALIEGRIQGAIRALKLDDFEDDRVVHLQKAAGNLSLQGLMEITYMGQPFNEETDSYEGSKQEYKFLLPFRITFAPPGHLKIRFLKFSPSRQHRRSDGGLVMIRTIDFDPTDAIEHLKAVVVKKVTQESFVRANLTSGVKSLVKDKKFSAIYAAAEDEDGEGVDHRTKNNTSSGSLIEYNWFRDHLLSGTRIAKTRWFWIEGVADLEDPTKLDCVTVDCDSASCSKDRVSADDHEWLVDEIIGAND